MTPDNEAPATGRVARLAVSFVIVSLAVLILCATVTTVTHALAWWRTPAPLRWPDVVARKAFSVALYVVIPVAIVLSVALLISANEVRLPLGSRRPSIVRSLSCFVLYGSFVVGLHIWGAVILFGGLTGGVVAWVGGGILVLPALFYGGTLLDHGQSSRDRVAQKEFVRYGKK